MNQQELITQVQRLVVLIKNELFLWQSNDDVHQQVELVLNALEQHDMVKQSKAGFWSVSDEPQSRAQLRLMGECIDETMQRFAIITSLVTRMAPIGKKPLEENVVAIAKRLSAIQGSEHLKSRAARQKTPPQRQGQSQHCR